MKYFLALTLLTCGIANAYPNRYEYDCTSFVKQQQREFNDEFDRMENRMFQQEQNRILRDIKRQNSSIYGR